MARPANRALPVSSSRSSTWETRRVAMRPGRAVKAIRPALGRRVSRPAVAGLMLACSSCRRLSRPNPSSVRIWPTLARWSTVPSAASAALISYTDRPRRRSAMTRARAASLRGALLGPGLPGGAELPVDVDHRPAGVTELRAGLGKGEPGDVVGAQCLVAAPVHLVRGGE